VKIAVSGLKGTMMHKTKHLNVNQLIFDMTSVTAHLGKPILIIHDVQIQFRLFLKPLIDSVVTQKCKLSNKKL